MNKETIKFLWEIYSDLIKEKENQAGEDYPMYNIEGVILKLKERIDLELKA
jgi:hypothetical protein